MKKRNADLMLLMLLMLLALKRVPLLH